VRHIGYKTVALLLGFSLAFLATLLNFVEWWVAGADINVYKFFLTIILTAIVFPLLLYVAHILWVLWYKTEEILLPEEEKK